MFVIPFGTMSTKAQNVDRSADITDLYNVSNIAKGELFVQSQYSPTSYVFLGKTPHSSSYRTTIGFVFLSTYGVFDTHFSYSMRWHPRLAYRYSKRDQGGKLKTVYGWGLDPIGLVKSQPLSSSTHFETALFGGFTYVSHDFPTDMGRRLNFTFEAQLTLKQIIDSKYIISIGTSYHHISNAQTGSENPGIDSLYMIAKLSYLFTN